MGIADDKLISLNHSWIRELSRDAPSPQETQSGGLKRIAALALFAIALMTDETIM